MLFLVLSDVGLSSVPIQASTIADAADQIRLLYGAGLNGDTVTPVRIALLAPQAMATVVPNVDPAQATLQVTGEAATQKNLRDNAKQALADNQTYLGIGSPTNAQVVAQVAALTRQCNGLIRLALGEVG